MSLKLSMQPSILSFLASGLVSFPLGSMADGEKSTFAVEDILNWNGDSSIRQSERISGYRGIWFTLGSLGQYGAKYSGGLGTYTASHQPMAVYSPASQKTFFTYGGTPAANQRALAIMVSYYDHATGKVPKPVILYLDPSVDDPHDNASLQLDTDGYVWVFKSGRGVGRPGIIFRSAEPYSIDAFECVSVQEFTYPQIWHHDRNGFFLLCSKYRMGNSKGMERNLFWQTSSDGRAWSVGQPLAAFGGHYQTSGQWGGKIATFFNWHPNGNVDERTNVYYAQTTDWGKTWTTADGTPLKLPLDQSKNEALVADFQASGQFIYTCDLNFDIQGNPMLLCISSRSWQPGPKGQPREWMLLHWKRGAWEKHVVTTSDNNYDMGSLMIQDEEWQIIGPTEKPPQQYGTGGEMALWISRDEGENWTMGKQLTSRSPFNHSYARRPIPASDAFAAFWADGDPRSISPSHLYIFNRQGNRVLRLPYNMDADFAFPEICRR